ncbi:N-acetylmuramoyl-L-alanine amidase [bacterium]|nr:N-acetylmuramoyl-L-alanine amidase [bacterium]
MIFNLKRRAFLLIVFLFLASSVVPWSLGAFTIKDILVMDNIENLRHSVVLINKNEIEYISITDFAYIFDGYLEKEDLFTKVIFKERGKEVIFNHGSKEVFIDNEKIFLDTPCQIIKRKSYIPFSFIRERWGEIINISIIWKKEQDTLILEKKKEEKDKKVKEQSLKVFPPPYPRQRGIEKDKEVKEQSLAKEERKKEEKDKEVREQLLVKEERKKAEKDKEVKEQLLVKEEKKKARKEESLIKEKDSQEKTVSFLKKEEVVFDKRSHKRSNQGVVDLITIDPGHGGKDPGAVGSTGLKEKDVNLEVAKRVKELIETKSNIKVMMTRQLDEFIPLRRRSEMANAIKSKLFISIHANASFSEGADGFETYYLSAVASDNTARAVSLLENGVIEIENGAASKDYGYLEFILADMAQNQFIEESIELAGILQEIAKKKLNIKSRGIKSALFYVLKDTTMPAILVEVGFVSNPTEEQRLKDSCFKEKIAECISEAILAYKDKYKESLGFTK